MRKSLFLFFLALEPFVGQSQNLLINPSFELGTYSPLAAPGYVLVNPGETKITGWTISVDQVAWVQTPNVDSLIALDGLYQVDLTGFGNTPPHATISQVVNGLSVGQQYRISFALGISGRQPFLNGPATVRAFADSQFADFTAPSIIGAFDTWTKYDFDFTPSTSSVTVGLTGISGQSYIGVDNLSLTAVPEPSTLCLTAFAGIGLLLGWTRRAKLNS